MKDIGAELYAEADGAKFRRSFDYTRRPAVAR